MRMDSGDKSAWRGRCVWRAGLLIVVFSVLFTPLRGWACDSGDLLEPQITNLLSNAGFESGTTDWFPVGSFTMLSVTGAPASGCQFLLATNRTALWQGPGRTVTSLLATGHLYRVSAWVRVDGIPSSTAVITLKQTDDGGVRYAYPAYSAISSGDWTKLTGYHNFTATGAVSEVMLYVEQAGDAGQVAPALLVDEVILEDVSVSGSSSGVTYYVDGLSGSDANTGTSEGQAWRSGAAVSRFYFQPGDAVRFHAGQAFTNQQTVELRGAGTLEHPVTVGAYGTGDVPRLCMDAVAAYRGVLDVVEGSFVIEGLALEGVSTSPVAEFGIRLGSAWNLVQDVEISGTGYGITVHGHDQVIRDCLIRDLLMLVNDPAPDNDYGAIGILLHDTSNAVVQGVQFERLCQPSYDYITDGSAVECYGSVQQVEVSGCLVTACQALTELGSSDHSDWISFVHFHHNLMLETIDQFGYVHNSTQGTAYGVHVADLRLDNNTLIKTSTNRSGMVVGFAVSPSPEEVLFRNNVLSLAHLDAWGIRAEGMTRSNNLYDITDVPGYDFILTNGEQLAAAQFVDAAGGDYRLAWGSPARDAGALLGYAEDYNGHVIPQGAAPDMGAFERMVVFPDEDGDGMSDVWELEQFISLGVADASSDQDGDGMLDVKEFIAGTEPTNSQSVLVIDQVSLGVGEDCLVQWTGRGTNRLYTLLWATNLHEAMVPLRAEHWQPGSDETTEMIATDAVHSAWSPVYYRLKVELDIP